MPFAISIPVAPISQDEFYALDHRVMAMAFAIHNEVGRFCDENVYRDELANRCKEAGLIAHREVQIKATHKGFQKDYFVDLLINHSAVYELKATESLTPDHHRQVISYLLMAELTHGKLVNFRSPSVQHRFCSTTICHDDRKKFACQTAGCDSSDALSQILREWVIDLVNDFGTRLDRSLYRDAVLHFSKTTGPGITDVPLNLGGRVIGQQKLHLLDQYTACHVTTLDTPAKPYHTHL